MKHKTFCMKLANFQGWNFVSTRDTAHWVGKLASIMNLRECPGESVSTSKLFFISGDSEVKNSLDSYRSKIADREEWQKLIFISLNRRSHDANPKLGALISFWVHTDTPDVFCDLNQPDGTLPALSSLWMSLQPVYDQVRDSGGLSLHSALIQRDDAGFMLVGASGTGKSTCCRRLPESWKALCDDETLVLRDTNDQYVAHPFPTWNDHARGESHRNWDVQHHVPLKAIFFLKQSKRDFFTSVDQNQAVISINRAADHIFQRAIGIRDQNERRKLKAQMLDNSLSLAKAIPSFILNVSPDGTFWNEIDKALDGIVRQIGT